jgi:mannitol operon repressor
MTSHTEHGVDTADLEAFLSEHPQLRGEYAILCQIANESPRGMVLVAAAELDRLLLDLMKSFLRPGAGQNALLTEGNAPLATFSGKIAAAHALNLISDQEFRELNIIRRVRNEFAHEINVSFERQTVKSRVQELSQYRATADIAESFEASVVKLILGHCQRKIGLLLAGRVVSRTG